MDDLEVTYKLKKRISNLLNEDKEQNDGNVIDIKGKGSSKT